MSYNHSNVYIVRVVDTDDQGTDQTWFAGPYGATPAERTAAHLKSVAERDRQCYLEPVYSDDGCLRVTNDGRTQGSLY